MDLDHFKQVNDNGGHAAGDALLQELVNKIGHIIRRNDIFARTGGDEFALILEGCPLSNARRIALEIRDTVRDNRFTWQGQEYRVGISIGMVTLDSETYSTTELLSLADDACYSAKEGGRNQIHYYTENAEGVRFIEVTEATSVTKQTLKAVPS
jgi:diguanylate cyclase (GGDEF)-like protein